MANSNEKASVQNNGGGSNPSIKRYETDVSGVSINKLEAGLWWVRNRGLFKKILVSALAIFAFGTFGYSLFGFGYYFIKGMRDDEKMVRDMVNTTTVSREFLEQKAAKDLSLSSVGIIDNTESYDLYISIKNQNPKHWGSFSYCFKIGEKDLECGESFVLPSENKIISALGLKGSSRPNNVKFVIDNMVWKKINPHQIPDWNSYKSERLRIDIKNVSFKPSSSNELSEKIELNSLTFNASNPSAYGFWEAPLNVILYRSNRIVGINRYVIKELSSYDSRDIKITWTGNLAGVNNIDILPDINIMDESNYLKPGR